MDRRPIIPFPRKHGGTLVSWWIATWLTPMKIKIKIVNMIPVGVICCGLL